MGSKALIVAASVGAVEALKDRGLCRWNHTIKSIHQHAKNNLRSFSQANSKISPNSSSLAAGATVVSNKAYWEGQAAKQFEESLRKVMYLSCWGSN